MTLAPKHQRFVDEYLVDTNGSAAAVRAGYSKGRAKKTAYDLLHRDDVKAAVARGTAARVGRTQMTQDYVVGNLTEVVERCLQRAPVMMRQGRHMVQVTDDEGRHVWTFNANGAVAALGLLGKHLGMFVERAELTGPDGGPLQVQAWKIGDNVITLGG